MLEDTFSLFSKSRILVVGDVMLDEYIKGVVDRISPEAPVPVLHVRSESYVPGGAANVANNIVALGGKVHLVGVVGYDVAGERLCRLLDERGIDSSYVVKDRGYTTTQKTRLIAHTQHVARVDREGGSHKSLDALRNVLSEKIANGTDAIIVSDYRKGVITKELMDFIKSEAGRYGKPIIVDPKPPHIDIYKGVSLVTPNIGEAEKLSLISYDGENIDAIGKAIVARLDADVLITRGEHGMSLFMRDKPAYHLPADARQVFDVSGAGDTVVATLGLCLGAGLSLFESASLANYAAGIVVEKVGTATVTPQELEQRVREKTTNRN